MAKRIRKQDPIERTLKLFARLVTHGHGTLTVTFTPGEPSPTLHLAPNPHASREPIERFLKVADVAILEGLSPSQVRAKAAAKEYDVDDKVRSFLDPSGHWKIPERGVTQRDVRNSTRARERMATRPESNKTSKGISKKASKEKRKPQSTAAFRDKMSTWRTKP